MDENESEGGSASPTAAFVSHTYKTPREEHRIDEVVEEDHFFGHVTFKKGEKREGEVFFKTDHKYNL